MLQIVPQACTFESDYAGGVIVIESDRDGPPFTDAFEELGGNDAVRFAQAYASQQGVAPVWLNGNKIGPYPVNEDGRSLDAIAGPDGAALPATHPKMQPKRYRIDVPVRRPIR